MMMALFSELILLVLWLGRARCLRDVRGMLHQHVDGQGVDEDPSDPAHKHGQAVSSQVICRCLCLIDRF